MSNFLQVKRSQAGVLYSIVGFRNMTYILFSKKGVYRGGKKRNKKKRMVLLSGSAVSCTIISGKEHEQDLKRFRVYSVPAGIPHLLYFSEDAWFFEWWDRNYSEEKYKPFYDLKK